MASLNLDMDFLRGAAADLLPRGPALVSAAAVVLGLAAIVGLDWFLNNYALGNALFFKDKSWDWAKEIVLVTGGSSGIGRVMVAEFARRGIKVVALDVQPPLEAEDDPFSDDGVWFYQADITSDDALRAVAERVRKEVGEPTVVINNAGVGHGQTLLDATPDQIRRVFAVNAVAPMLVTREFLPDMVRRNHGHIVNIASLASFVSIANNIDYSCTKAAVLALHEGLVQELRHRYNAPRIRTTIVHPNWVKTPMLSNLPTHKNFRNNILDAKYVSKTVVDQVLAGRSGQIFLPRHLFIAGWVRSAPIWLQERIRNSQANMLKIPI